MKLTESMTQNLSRSVRWAWLLMVISFAAALGCAALGVLMIANQLRSPGTFSDMAWIAGPVLGAVAWFIGGFQLWGFASHGAAAIRYEDPNAVVRAQSHMRSFWTIPYRIIWAIAILLFAVWFLNTMLYPVYRTRLRMLDGVPQERVDTKP